MTRAMIILTSLALWAATLTIPGCVIKFPK